MESLEFVSGLLSSFVINESSIGMDLGRMMYSRLLPNGTLVGPDPSLSKEELIALYRQMLLGRRFDEKAMNLSTLREIGTFGACRGQEATQVGFISALKKERDWFVPMYRDSAAMIAFGYPPEMILQYYGGDEGGMRIPQGIKMMPIIAPVSGQLPHAVGIAMAMKKKKENSVVLTSTGDGGTSKGDFHEALNFAGVYRAPVVFAVENNQWAISVRREMQTASKTLAQKAVAYGFEGILVDGNDVIACHEATLYAVEKARQGKGPTLIEFYTYRMGPHTTAELVSNKLKDAEEIAEWEKKDPILRMERFLASRGLLSSEEEGRIKEEIEREIAEAISKYRAMQRPRPVEMFMHVYDRPTVRLVEQMSYFESSIQFAGFNIQEPESSSFKELRHGVNIRNAINMALRQEMARDSRIVVFGEDVGKNGGVFQVTRGLQEEFGEERVFDTPLAEACIAGIFVGLAVGGLIPVAEFQFDGFTYSAFDQIFSHIARMRNRTRGRYNARGVIRFPYGAGIRAPEHHSDSPEAYFCHTPGLKVVVPSNPYDAKGLLASALREENPIVFMEPKKLYDAPKMDVPEQEYTIPIGRAKVLTKGDDITIVSYGAMMIQAREAAAELLEKYSISTELIDLRTISPLDTETLISSVKKTGRIVVVHEAQGNCGVGAEVVSTVCEKAIEYMKAPPRRVTGFDTFVPLAKLEDSYLPSKERIVNAALSVVRY